MGREGCNPEHRYGDRDENATTPRPASPIATLALAPRAGAHLLAAAACWGRAARGRGIAAGGGFRSRRSWSGGFPALHRIGWRNRRSGSAAASNAESTPALAREQHPRPRPRPRPSPGPGLCPRTVLLDIYTSAALSLPRAVLEL